mgnify:CR=1 FL=1
MVNNLFRICGCLLLLGALLAGCQPAVRSESVVTFTILHQNDVHGAILPATVALPDGTTRQQGGMVTLSRYLTMYRAANPGRTLFFNAGDWFQGTPEGNESRGESMVDLFNTLRLDAAAPGNHEFDFGADNFARLARQACFPVLASNLESARTGQRPEFLPVDYWQKDIDGVRLIAFGLLTHEAATTTSGDLRRSYRVTDEVAATRLAVAALRGKCDILICLSHAGVDIDKELARQFPELDLVIGGHSHTMLDTPYVEPASGVTVAQAGGKGAMLGKLDLQFDRTSRRIVGIAGELVPLVADLPGLPAADPFLVARVNRWTEPVANQMAQIYGRTTVALTRSNLAAAPASSLLGNWLCDIMRAKTGAQIAFHNRAGIRADIPAGPITERHLYEVSPFGNKLAVLRLTGEQVRAVVTHALSNPRLFLDVSGLTVTVAPGEAPDAFTVRGMTVSGRALQDRQVYTVVTNDFLADGGDGFDMFRAGSRRGPGTYQLLEVSRSAVRAVPAVTPANDNRFVRAAQ